MNILHHKSWHIRNKRNIDRVRRDEAAAAEKEADLQSRHEKANRERTFNALRGKNSSSNNNDNNKNDPTNSLLPTNSSSDGRTENSVNLERQKELIDREEQLKYKLGAIQNLGQTDLKRNRPLWYNINPTDDRNGSNYDPDKEEKRLNRVLFDDPLKNIPRESLNSKYTKSGAKLNQEERLKPSENYMESYRSAQLRKRPIDKVYNSLAQNSDESDNSNDERKKSKKSKKRSKKEKKDKKKKKKSSKREREKIQEISSDSCEEEDQEQMRAKMERLRAQRLAREKKAREQADYLRNYKNVF